ncbi:hypothetical protein IVA80_20665 [Bradyrhizobium sp. 139]|uniref:hypothetical protein n=1 Tax=Bradyrhizobium sp. 139 TaxID=2782616 RepID=UPI001FFBF93D|nr:hypothetical protein [Bradyrhizobium sp. 139]MCK1743205.1 hypothetical protein [Bradyrhizobium sp. 139]
MATTLIRLAFPFHARLIERLTRHPAKPSGVSREGLARPWGVAEPYETALAQKGTKRAQDLIFAAETW